MSDIIQKEIQTATNKNWRILTLRYLDYVLF